MVVPGSQKGMDEEPVWRRVSEVNCSGEPEAQERASEVQGCLQLHTEFEARLGHMRPCLKRGEVGGGQRKKIKRSSGDRCGNGRTAI